MAEGAAGVYKCGANLAWTSTSDTITANVPIGTVQVEALARHYFTKPRRLPMDVHIALNRSITNPSVPPARGQLLRISPVEMVAALYSSIARDIMADAGNEILDEWRVTLLTASFVFQYIEGLDRIHFAAYQIREDLGADFKAMRFSTLQKIFDVQNFVTRKTRGGQCPLPAAEVAKIYSDNIRFSGASESVTDGFVDTALTVSSRLLSIPAVREVLVSFDSEYGLRNPFDSSTKLQVICSKASTPECITWTVLLLADFIKSGALHVDQLALRTLSGAGSGLGGKGMVDLLVMKKDILAHLLNFTMDTLHFPMPVKAAIRTTCTTIDQFRERCGYRYNEKYKAANRGWTAGFCAGAEEFLNLIEVRACGQRAKQTHKQQAR